MGCLKSLISILQKKGLKKRWRKQACGPADDGGTGVASTICWTNSSVHPWRTETLPKKDVVLE